MKTMRKVAKMVVKEGIRLTIMEDEGKTVKRMLQSSNPTATPGYEDRTVLLAKMEEGKEAIATGIM